ncbi:MAG: alanine racemase [Propionibacteriaceae bacterium]|jgi:alanine racemase|nr:alanine racemase [Propionibacteriaceae bacterium]
MSTGSVAKVSLEAIRHNLEGVRRRVGDRLVMPAVKADGYGLGAVPISRMIEETGVADRLAVALVSEGVALREAGIRLPLMKLSRTLGVDEAAAALGAGMTVPVVDELSIREVAEAARQTGVEAEVHLKVDTGMRRIGVEPEQAAALAELAVKTGGVRLTGVFSHMPVSDTPSQDDFSRGQIERFRRICEQVEQTAGPLTKHLANSGAILAHPDAWFDLVRPGIMIYGAYPDPKTPRTVPLEPVVRWTTSVTTVKRIRAGETVGYGRTWAAPQDTWIATFPVGYADGYSRLLSNRGSVLIRGRRHPIAGRVCMDQTMADLGPETDVRVGDQVTLIGSDGDESITTDDIAALMGTIPYEVTCLLGRRVVREYEA